VAGVNLKITIKGIDKLKKKLDTPTIKKPLDDGIKKIALVLEGLIKKSTVVDTGRLRSSITATTTAEFSKVATNVNYASHVEFGNERMDARHMEGGTKVLGGLGMFGFGLQELNKKMGNLVKDIGSKIETKFSS